MPATNHPNEARWKQRYRAPFVLKTRLAARTPERGLAIMKDAESYHLAAWDVTGKQVHKLVDGRDGWIAPDGDYIYYLRDYKGSELGHIARVPYAGGEPEDVTPGFADYTLRGFDISLAGNRLAFDAVNADGYQFYGIDIGPDGELGAPRLIYCSTVETWESLLSFGGEIMVVKTSAAGERRRYSLLALDVASGTPIATLSDGPEHNAEPVTFAPLADDLRLLAVTTNQDGFKRPLIWNPRTAERIDLSLPNLAGEIEPLDWSPDGQRLLLRQSYRAAHQLYFYELASATLEPLAHPDGNISGLGGGYHCGKSSTYFGPDGQIWANWQDAASPPQTIALDAETGEQTGTILTAGDAPSGRRLESVTYTSSDGEQIQAWVGVPAGEGPFPTILHVHGGPHGTMTDIYSPSAQCWLDHGFAYMTINFRGSLGFGLNFRAKIEGNIGHWELADMVAARDWLVDQGIADPNAILLHGGSYGAFLTLFGLGKRPDLWAGGITLVALADWATMYEDASDALKGFSRVLFGGSPQEQPERYRASSPITYVENVAAPLLVIQGKHDSRTPARQLEQYAAKMRAHGKSIEVIWFDAGHGTIAVEQTIEFQTQMLRFAHRVLGMSEERIQS